MIATIRTRDGAKAVIDQNPRQGDVERTFADLTRRAGTRIPTVGVVRGRCPPAVGVAAADRQGFRRRACHERNERSGGARQGRARADFGSPATTALTAVLLPRLTAGALVAWTAALLDRHRAQVDLWRT